MTGRKTLGEGVHFLSIKNGPPSAFGLGTACACLSSPPVSAKLTAKGHQADLEIGEDL